MANQNVELQWKVHLPNLFQEILNNPSAAILEKPLIATASLLFEVAERSAELNDPLLNALMCRLTLYQIADPEMDDYDQATLEEVYRLAEEVSQNLDS